jgi:4-oxalomesaconate hydratase
MPPAVRPDIFFFESSVPPTEFNGFRPDAYVDITDEFEVKISALRKLRSQPFLVDYYTRYAEYRGFQASKWFKTDIRYAEGFARYTPWVGRHLPTSERARTEVSS